MFRVETPVLIRQFFDTNLHRYPLEDGLLQEGTNKITQCREEALYLGLSPPSINLTYHAL
jgi:hypothetical protein